MRLEAIERDEEEVDGEGHPERDEDVGDVEAGVEVGADGGGHGEGGVEAGAVGVVVGGEVREEADAEGVDGEQKGEDAEGEGEAGGPVVDAEEAHGAGGHPVHEGRLVEEADAVDGGGDEVVALQHLAGDLDVDGVDVVEQAGGEEAADLQDEPGGDECREGGEAPAADGASGGVRGRVAHGVSGVARVAGLQGFRDHRRLERAACQRDLRLGRVERPVGDEEFAGGFFENDLVECRGGGRLRRVVRRGRRGFCGGRGPSWRARSCG